MRQARKYIEPSEPLYDFLYRLFSPEIILPGQAGDGSRRRVTSTSHTGLMVAVLEDALNCLFKPNATDTLSEQQEALVWFQVTDGQGTFSFRSICAVLDFDEGACREAILRKYHAMQSQQTNKLSRRVRLRYVVTGNKCHVVKAPSTKKRSRWVS